MSQPFLTFASGWRAKRRLFRWLGAGLSLLAAAFLLYLLWSDRAALAGLEWGRYGRLVPAMLSLYFGSLLSQGLAWLVLASSWHGVTWKDIEIFSRSTMMKALPGTAWHWLGRTAMYSGETALPGGAVVRATALEVVFLILSALALIPHGLADVATPVAVLSSGLALATAILLGLRWLPRPHPRAANAWRPVMLVLLYGLAWVCGGLILKGLTQAAGAPELGWKQATTVWSVTGTAGLLVSFLPSSLGLRELILVLLLAPNLPAARIVVLGGLLRLLFLAGDLVWGTVGWVMAWVLGHSPTASPGG